MKIFISWSAERSKQVASALHEWLPLVLHYAEPWMSDVDIESGARGFAKIATELDGRNFGIICVTHENLRAPWINFEAGALSKSVEDGRVVPLLLGLDAKDVPPPLGQFQAKRIDKAGVKNLVFDINKACAEKIDEARLETLFDRLWDDFEAKILSIPAAAQPSQALRKESDILEEVVTGIRTIDGRLGEVFNDLMERPSRPMRRGRRLHPMMLMDMSDDLFGRSGDPIVLVFLAGIFRDEAPWLSEVLNECYRGLSSDQTRQVEMSLVRLREVVRMLERGHPLFRELLSDSKESFMILKEIPIILDRLVADRLQPLEHLSKKPPSSDKDFK
jgi:hypothetical protein